MRLDGTSINSDSREYFLEMFHADSLRIAQPFLTEEKAILCNLITQHECDTFIGVGSGAGLYFESISLYCRYIGIDPCYQLETPKIINKQFQDVSFNRMNGKFLFSFIFNLISYISPVHVIDFLNKNTSQGDIVTLSCWKNNSDSIYLRKHYLKSINTRLNRTNLLVTKDTNNFNEIDPKKICLYKNHEILNLEYSKILIIYL